MTIAALLQTPAREGTFLISIAVVARARVLLGDVLPLDARAVVQRQHDRADHRGQQHQARRLEQIDILRVEHLAERRGVGDAGGDRRRQHRLARAGALQPADATSTSSTEHDRADQRADRQILARSPGAARRNRRRASSRRTGTAPPPRRHRRRPGSSRGIRRRRAGTGPPPLTKARMRNSTEWTGLRATITMNAEAISDDREQIEECSPWSTCALVRALHAARS